MAQVIEKMIKMNLISFFLKKVGSRTYEYQRRQRIIQAQMAQKLGIAVVSYNSIEHGIIETTLKTLLKVIQILCVFPVQLLLEVGEILYSILCTPFYKTQLK